METHPILKRKLNESSLTDYDAGFNFQHIVTSDIDSPKGPVTLYQSFAGANPLVCISPQFTTKVPQLKYRHYRGYHARRQEHGKRSESDCEQTNYFYQPQVIRVSPRSKVKVFSYFPILRQDNFSVRKGTKKQEKSNISQQYVLPAISTKTNSPVRRLPTVMTYGQKLWDLNEVAGIEKN
jgi:hypothetical protein